MFQAIIVTCKKSCFLKRLQPPDIPIILTALYIPYLLMVTVMPTMVHYTKHCGLEKGSRIALPTPPKAFS
jgi:hypothetical protein